MKKKKEKPFILAQHPHGTTTISQSNKLWCLQYANKGKNDADKGKYLIFQASLGKVEATDI